MGETMDVTALATFAAAFLFFAASPGPDNVTIIARTIAQGAASGLAYGAGTCTGILLFLCLAVFGLSVVASEMGAAMTVLRYAGALYLVWMGIKLWTARPVVADLDARPRQGVLSSYVAGVVLNLGNPKMPLFYIALLPNVVGTSLTAADGGMLAAVILVVEVLVVGGHVALATRARRALRSPVVVRRVNRAAGTVMIGAGAAVIAAR
jgi:threonine/homoserine/homoserine lactone efflux protein